MRRSCLRVLLFWLPLAAVLALAAIVMGWPRYGNPDVMGVAALALLGAALWSGGRAIWYRPGWPFFALVAAAMALAPFAVIVRGFGSVDLGAVFFHTWAGMPGAGLSVLHREIGAVVPATVLMLLVLYLAAGQMRRAAAATLAAALALAAANPLWRHLADGFVFPVPDLRLAGALVWPDAAAAPAGPLPDIVHVYLEGLDRRFLDPGVGGDAYAPLARLAAGGIAFTDIREVAGTGWSVAGIAASHCGVPLTALVRSNNAMTRDLQGPFLPGATCLGDVLAARGYRAEFLVGSNAAFAGIGNFLHSHGIPTHRDLDWIEGVTTAEERAAAALPWGVDDQMLLDLARGRFAAMAEGPDPIYLAVETIGPHGTTSYLSRACTADGRAAETRDLPAAVACLADLAAGFVAAIRAAHAAAGRDRPLRIILQSDHLNHARELAGGDPALDRNTLILLGGPGGRTVDAPGSMLDVYPTLLDWLGLAPPGAAAGLGRSLLPPGGGPSLVVLHDRATLDRALVRDTALFDRLWRGRP